MEPSGYAAWPDYHVDIRRIRNLVRVTRAGQILAESTASLLVLEQDHGIVHYLPATDIRFDLLLPDPDTTSRCPFKGSARYWRPTDSPTPIAWEYPDPYPETSLLRGHIAFYQDRVRLEIGVATPAVSGPARIHP